LIKQLESMLTVILAQQVMSVDAMQLEGVAELRANVEMAAPLP
jgi:hypothetical protein